MIFTHGRGCYVFDQSGKKYLDFLGGIAVNALGYAHPRPGASHPARSGPRDPRLESVPQPISGAAGAQAGAMVGHGSRIFHQQRHRSHRRRAETGAACAAQKRGATGKTRILALENSFHGRTFGALSITHPAKYREPFEPLVPGVEFVRVNDVADLEAKFDDTVCAIVIEPMQGEGGIYPVSGTFWTRARELATQHGAALIADEIQCGLGRTGGHLPTSGYIGLPDIVVVAKPLAGGLPLGAILAHGRVCRGVFARPARLHVWRRPADVRGGAGIS